MGTLRLHRKWIWNADAIERSDGKTDDFYVYFMNELLLLLLLLLLTDDFWFLLEIQVLNIQIIVIIMAKAQRNDQNELIITIFGTWFLQI